MNLVSANKVANQDGDGRWVSYQAALVAGAGRLRCDRSRRRRRSWQRLVGRRPCRRHGVCRARPRADHQARRDLDVADPDGSRRGPLRPARRDDRRGRLADQRVPARALGRAAGLQRRLGLSALGHVHVHPGDLRRRRRRGRHGGQVARHRVGPRHRHRDDRRGPGRRAARRRVLGADDEVPRRTRQRRREGARPGGRRLDPLLHADRRRCSPSRTPSSRRGRSRCSSSRPSPPSASSRCSRASASLRTASPP